MVPAAKLPEASLLTIVEAVFALVAALARFAPEATLVEVTPPTVETTVADWVPVTSPDSEPEKLVEVTAVVALVAFPDKVAVIVPAAKFPEASLRTIVEGVLSAVELFARPDPVATEEAVDPPTSETTVADCVPVTSPDREPVKLVELVALPMRVAVMVPAEKLPDESLDTIAFGVAALVAVVAELATFPAVEMV
jgi:hypothetical protein